MEHICSTNDTWNITVEAKSGQPVTKQTNKQVQTTIIFSLFFFQLVFVGRDKETDKFSWELTYLIFFNKFKQAIQHCTYPQRFNNSNFPNQNFPKNLNPRKITEREGLRFTCLSREERGGAAEQRERG
jgi:hypothetical protein